MGRKKVVVVDDISEETADLAVVGFLGALVVLWIVAVGNEIYKALED
jgi:hypothetical protein